MWLLGHCFQHGGKTLGISTRWTFGAEARLYDARLELVGSRWAWCGFFVAPWLYGSNELFVLRESVQASGSRDTLGQYGCCDLSARVGYLW